MAVYMILEIEAVDPATYARYVEQAPATVALYGGRYLVRGGAVTPVTGGWDPKRLVVLEFPSMERFHKWLTSSEYSTIAPLREQWTRGKAVVVERYAYAE